MHKTMLYQLVMYFGAKVILVFSFLFTRRVSVRVREWTTELIGAYLLFLLFKLFVCFGFVFFFSFFFILLHPPSATW